MLVFGKVRMEILREEEAVSVEQRRDPYSRNSVPGADDFDSDTSPPLHPRSYLLVHRFDLTP